MILLQRIRGESSIPAKYRAPRKDRHELDLMRRRLAREEPRPSHWSAAKRLLKRETFGKCAYCEAPTDTVAHGDVEHFRPQGKYWWLAYCWDNWLFACQICNQSYKNDQFPVAGRRMREWAIYGADLEAIAGSLAPCPLDGDPRYGLTAYWREVKTERADLVDPYREDPARVIAWEADAIEREVRLVPAAQNAVTKRRARACERVLGLNREELCRERWTTYHTLDLLAQAWAKLPDNDPLLAEIERKLESMMAEESSYAGMCRYFVRSVWGLPF
jgi:uncharacterized protein (TIGR02646 family)